MACKRLAALLTLGLLGFSLPTSAELIRRSLLLQKRSPFSIRRDIFMALPLTASATASDNTQDQPGSGQSQQATVQEEISQSISYEGFLVKENRKTALLSIGGDVYVVGEGETILERIKVLSISREMITIEYEGQPYQIKLKGDENG